MVIRDREKIRSASGVADDEYGPEVVRFVLIRTRGRRQAIWGSGITKIHRDRFRAPPFFTFPEEAPSSRGCENRHPPTCYFVKHEPRKL